MKAQIKKTLQQTNHSIHELDHRARLKVLAHHRFVLAFIMGLLTTILMTVFVGYHAVFTIFLGIIVGIGTLLVLPSSKQTIDGTSR